MHHGAGGVPERDAISDTDVFVAEDPDEPNTHRFVAQRKANFSRLAPIERHRIEPIILPGTVDPDTGHPVETSRMVFVDHPDDVNADDLLGPRERQDTKEAQAKAFLAAALAAGGWHDSAGLKRLAAAAGISEPTLKRAAHALHVEHKREGFPSSTWWRRPQLAHVSATNLEPSGDSAQPRGFGACPGSSQLSSVGSGPTEPTREQLDLRTARLDEIEAQMPVVLGDEMFPVLLANAVRDAHITHREAEGRYALHKRVTGE